MGRARAARAARTARALAGACAALLALAVLAGCGAAAPEVAADGSAQVSVAPAAGSVEAAPVVADDVDAPSTRGALHVEGTRLVGVDGEPVQLRGVSTHGLAWFPGYVNDALFGEMRQDWGANVVRLALYTDESGGYCTDGDQAALRSLVDDGVRYATDNDLYVIIDWHILHDLTPLAHADEAEAFFRDVSAAYADHDNVIYEICNEPNGGTTWADVKSYAERIIPVIRESDPDAVVIVGTPTWSQDVDQAAADPLDFDNVMYALHFYAATHKEDLRARMTAAVEAGLPVFVTEFGVCDASGNGALDLAQADAWVAEMDRLGVSYVMWNLSNKAESSSIIAATCEATSGFGAADLTEGGQWLLGVLGGTGASGADADADVASGAALGAADDGGATSDAASGATVSAPATGTRFASGGLDCLLSVRSSWEDGDRTAVLYDLAIRNTGAETNGWTVEIPFAGEVELTDSWNGTFELDGTMLRVSNVDYNAHLASGGTVSDVGFIVAADPAPELAV